MSEVISTFPSLRFEKLAINGIEGEFQRNPSCREIRLRSSRYPPTLAAIAVFYRRKHVYTFEFYSGFNCSPVAAGTRNGTIMQRPGRKDNDQTVVSDEDLHRISDYFWTAIDTPRGLIQKVWFDLMLHLGADGTSIISSTHTT